jgi:hypothetical protein
LKEQRLRLSQHQNDEPDFDDLHRLLRASAETQRTPTVVPPREGESVTRLEPEQMRQLQYEVAYHVKRDLLLSPQTAQRDSEQRPQFDLLLRSLAPEHMLPLDALASRLGNVRRLRSDAVDQMRYSELEVLLPQVDKEKSYTWISRVERGGRGVRVWQVDPEHPDQGYWAPYALRPGRDELMVRNGAWKGDSGGSFCLKSSRAASAEPFCGCGVRRSPGRVRPSPMHLFPSLSTLLANPGGGGWG